MPTAEEYRRIEKYVGPIQGWTSKRELAALFDVAKKCSGNGIIVEIGSWKGRSTVAIGLGSLAGNKTCVFAIDPHTGSPDHIAKHLGEKIWTFEEFKTNIKNAGLGGIVSPIVNTAKRTALSWNHPIAFLYLDVNYHSFEAGSEDFIEWSRFVAQGGTIGLHNTYPSVRAILFENLPYHGWPGPRKILHKIVFRKKGWKNIRIVDSTVFMQKANDSGFSDILFGLLTEMRGMFLIASHALYMFCVRTLFSFIPKSLKKRMKRVATARTEN